MVQPVVTRSQRRMESKQLLMAVILIIAVAGVSFYLGMLYGQQDGEMLGFANDSEKPKLPMVTQVKPPPKPQSDVAEETEKLTFYDNLPKGKQAPLGSGINLPPQKKKNVSVGTPKPEQVKVASLPAKTLPKVKAAPAATADGAFVVQVASFRTNEDAKKLAERLKTHNLTAFVETVDLGEKGTWHRVLSGPFESRDDADAAARLLREKERLSALVRQR